MSGGFMRRLSNLLRPRQAFTETDERSAAWLDHEEQRQMDEVRERLDRVREQLRSIDRRRSPRGTVSHG